MKHISESIIGRKGSISKRIPELQTHDIVRLSNGSYYIVITDSAEMHLTKMTFFGSQITKGILLKYESGYIWVWSWQPLNEYDDNLKIMPRYRTTSSLDIDAVYHSASASTTKYRDHFYMWCDEDNLKEKVSQGYGDYKLIWER